MSELTKDDVEKMIEDKLSELAPDHKPSLFKTIMITVFMLGLFFLFYGEPDVWDVAHEAVLEKLTTGN